VGSISEVPPCPRCLLDASYSPWKASGVEHGGVSDDSGGVVWGSGWLLVKVEDQREVMIEIEYKRLDTGDWIQETMPPAFSDDLSNGKRHLSMARV
jgi:hypothetical protein